MVLPTMGVHTSEGALLVIRTTTATRDSNVVFYHKKGRYTIESPYNETRAQIRLPRREDESRPRGARHYEGMLETKVRR